MSADPNSIAKPLIERIKHLTSDGQGTSEYLEAGGLSLTVLHDTVGGSHPLYAVLDNAIKKVDWQGA